MAVLDCPLCGRPLAALTARCPMCQGDLGPLAQLAALADEHYNRAVALARDHQWQGAAEQLAVTRALRPNDVEAIVLLAKVRYRQGGRRRAEAARLLRQALDLAPDRADVRAALDEAARPPRPPRRGRQGRRR